MKALLSRLWIKVHEISEDCREPIVVFSAVLRLSTALFFFRRYLTLSLELVEKRRLQCFWETMYAVFGPSFFSRDDRNFTAVC